MSLSALNSEEIQKFLTAHSYQVIVDDKSLQITKVRKRPLVLTIVFTLFGLFFAIFTLANIAFLFIGLAMIVFPHILFALTKPRPVHVNVDKQEIKFHAGAFSKERNYHFDALKNIELKDFIINSDANPFSDSTKQYIHTISLNFDEGRNEDLFEISDRDYHSADIIEGFIESLRGIFTRPDPA